MVEWASHLKLCIAEREMSATPAVAMLASVSIDGTPHARTVVIRRLDADGTMLIASDARSGKNEQLRADDRAELVFWFQHGRIQFRISGRVQIVDQSNDVNRLREEIWATLSNKTHAMYFWPDPGGPRDRRSDSFPLEVSAEIAPPESFTVLVLRPLEVETLDLTPHPHLRKRWQVGEQGPPVEINP